MAYKQAGKAAVTRTDFGRRHMAWRTEFCAVLHSADTSGFYKALAELTLSYLFVAHLASVPREEVASLDPEADLIELGKIKRAASNPAIISSSSLVMVV